MTNWMIEAAGLRQLNLAHPAIRDIDRTEHHRLEPTYRNLVQNRSTTALFRL
jgi:hypothetical protein